MSRNRFLFFAFERFHLCVLSVNHSKFFFYLSMMATQPQRQKTQPKTKQKNNQMVGIFSNGFIKLVQKTDRTHSKCHLLLVGGLPHKPTQATFFLMSAREREREKFFRSYPQEPRPLFTSGLLQS